MKANPTILKALEVTPRTKSVYPEPFATMMEGREKRALGDQFGLKKFGVNLTIIKPGKQSALMHRHSVSEEFIFVISGELVLVTENGEFKICAGECVGFRPNDYAHMLVNKSDEDAHYLEIGDREAGDSAEYPQDDIQAIQDENGKWKFFHKDGRPY
ncbi:MAG: cupin domain-containing protein [Bacteriovoracaceae bacterium]